MVLEAFLSPIIICSRLQLPPLPGVHSEVNCYNQECTGRGSVMAFLATRCCVRVPMCPEQEDTEYLGKPGSPLFSRQLGTQCSPVR